MTGPTDQQTARVNVDDDVWRRFRVLAIEADRSLADYLGQLVRDELRRAKRRADRSGDEGERDAARADSAREGPDAQPTPRSATIRLADVEVLTQLPRPAGHR